MPSADPASPSATDSSGGFVAVLARTLDRVAGALGLSALLVITIVSPGATRMYAWPWTLAYATALTAPAVQLVARLLGRRLPLATPPAAWSMLLLGSAAVVLASAFASPYRASAVLWSAPLLSALGFFFVLFDWLTVESEKTAARRGRLLRVATGMSLIIALASVAFWLSGLSAGSWRDIIAGRNPFPLGHANYTAGLALLIAPLCFAVAASITGWTRLAAWIGVLLSLVLLVTSGSRGGLLGLAVLVAVNLRSVMRVLHLRIGVVILAGALALAGFFFANSRIRSAGGGSEGIATSNVQRSAMLAAGWRMGSDRPLLGWGPGTTPLAFPRYRIGLSGGAENVLQLHSTPAELWTELGAMGVLAALGLVGLSLSAAFRSEASRAVVLAMSGYAVFCLTDWQLDVPIFAAAAIAAAVLMATSIPPADPANSGALRFGGLISIRLREDPTAQRRMLWLVTLLALVLVFAFGHRDPAPELNVRALAIGRDPARSKEAIALLRESLALNPHQEIAHFNLGWLLVVSDPAEAEKHFLVAARLVPDKGGVYLGLGLAQLNQNHREDAARSFAFECLNDPAFLVSPWWRVPEIMQQRTNTVVRLLKLEAQVIAALPAGAMQREAQYTRDLNLWLATGAPVEHPNTTARENYFAMKPKPPAFEQAKPLAYRRERTGYPVLMRNLDLAIPTDLFDVQENSLASGEFRFLFPPKGWLATPLLPALLAENTPRN